MSSLSVDKVASIRARIERNRRDRVALWRALYAEEAFRPSWPRRLALAEYPMRAPTGALVTHCELAPVDSDGGRLIRYICEDGFSWLEARPALYREPTKGNLT